MPLFLNDLEHGIVTVVTDERQHPLPKTECGSMPLGRVDGSPLGLFVSLPYGTQLSLNVFTVEEVPEEKLVSDDRFPRYY